jgi:hypothetical protein
MTLRKCNSVQTTHELAKAAHLLVVFLGFGENSSSVFQISSAECPLFHISNAPNDVKIEPMSVLIECTEIFGYLGRDKRRRSISF